MSSAVLALVLLGGLILFGMLVVLPIVAVVLEYRSKGANLRGTKGSADVRTRLQALEQRVAAQEARIAELKEMLEVNVLSIEERRALERRLGAPTQED
ncbi:MAG: hypothetical protein N2109_00155 [Fimbriimonadales bacterium]|nr:hypothetical protein [Fimbriimonadales bacterium]